MTGGRAGGPALGRALGLAAVVAVAGCGGATHRTATAPGPAPTTTVAPGYPSFLPRKTLSPAVDATLVGTMSRPALTVQGLAVRAETPSFAVSVTVSGPVVPGEGLPVQKAATTCTWTVTLTGATAPVPLSLAEFHSVDHLGSVFPLVLVPGEAAPPTTVDPGQTVTFRVRAYQLVGEGLMQWAPDQHHPVADWDYTIEND